VTQNPLTIEELRELINIGEAKDPLVFLEAVMNGQDPRRKSTIYTLIMDIQDFTGGDIGPSEWAELVDHVITNYKYKEVSLSESSGAARTLAEYLYAKRKQVDHSGGSAGKYDPAQQPLTEDEIELFKEKFNDEF